MSTSQARVEANRKNASLSTGPKTPEGKDASRGNALKHGLTGRGIAVMDADRDRIAEVASELRAKYRPTTTVGSAMIDHAATLIVRIDRCGKHELALVEDQVNAAVYDFYQGRRDWADTLFDGLEASPAGLSELLTFPEGIDRLVEEWSSLAAGDEWSAGRLARIVILPDPGISDPAILREFIPDLIRDLEDAKAAIDRRPIERACQHAADLALFGTSPEAILARKYEAATVRALDQAMKRFHEAESAPEIPQPPEPDAPPEPLGSFSPAPVERPESEAPARPTRPAVVPVSPDPQADRTKRPDPRKLREQMKRKHR